MPSSLTSRLTPLHRDLEDCISGVRLKTAELAISIHLSVTGDVRRAGYSDVFTLKDLARPLTASEAAKRALGKHPTQPVILCSAAGTGKTWSAVQLAHELALRCRPAATTDDVPLVPAIIYAQRLARMLQERLEDAPLDSSILLQFFAREYGAADQAHGKWLTMLSQALQMRTLIVIIDGIDEAAGRRDAVSKLIREVLVPEG